MFSRNIFSKETLIDVVDSTYVSSTVAIKKEMIEKSNVTNDRANRGGSRELKGGIVFDNISGLDTPHVLLSS